MSPSETSQGGKPFTRSGRLMEIKKGTWEDAILHYPGYIAVMQALDAVGIDGLERAGVSDPIIYGWLSSHESNHYKDKHGCGDVHSVLLDFGWKPERYETVMRPIVGSQLFADVCADFYRKMWEAAMVA